MVIFTTHVSIKRPASTGDPYEAATAPTIATRLAAHVSLPIGTEGNVGGARERIDAFGFLPAGTDVRHADIVVDGLTNRSYRVSTVVARTGLGLDHVKTTLVAVNGASNG